jgi:two-component system phosphate regulon response regulator PhoB
MAKVLVLDADDPPPVALLGALADAGHEVHHRTSGAEGLALAKALRPELVFLDLDLADGPATPVCRALGADPRALFVVLSQRSEELDRVLAFELGASDYVTKPYSVRELLLRAEAILRRAQTPLEDGASYLEAAGLRIDRAGYRVFRGAEELSLTLLELRLLLALLEQRGRVLSRGALLHGVWGLDISITTRTVDTHVKRLRDKLGSTGDLIQTVRGVGYRFAAEGE